MVINTCQISHLIEKIKEFNANFIIDQRIKENYSIFRGGFIGIQVGHGVLWRKEWVKTTRTGYYRKILTEIVNFVR